MNFTYYCNAYMYHFKESTLIPNGFVNTIDIVK